MSRSHRKTPIIGFTGAASEAWDKKTWHSRFRHNAKQKVNATIDFDNFIDLDYREVSNPWDMNKDGKQFIDSPSSKKYLRK